MEFSFSEVKKSARTALLSPSHGLPNEFGEIFQSRLFAEHLGATAPVIKTYFPDYSKSSIV